MKQERTMDKGQWKKRCQQQLFHVGSCDEPTTSSSMDLTWGTTELSVPIRKNMTWCTAWVHWHHRSVKEEIRLCWNRSKLIWVEVQSLCTRWSCVVCKKKSVCFKVEIYISYITFTNTFMISMYIYIYIYRYVESGWRLCESGIKSW